jgi:hypothetical protein
MQKHLPLWDDPTGQCWCPPPGWLQQIPLTRSRSAATWLMVLIPLYLRRSKTIGKVVINLSLRLTAAEWISIQIVWASQWGCRRFGYERPEPHGLYPCVWSASGVRIFVGTNPTPVWVRGGDQLSCDSLKRIHSSPTVTSKPLCKKCVNTVIPGIKFLSWLIF